MKAVSIVSILLLALLLGAGPCFGKANAIVSLRCGAADPATKVYLNGKLQGDCSNDGRLDLFVEPGTYALKAVKAVDADHEQSFEKSITAAANRPIRLQITLSARLTEAGEKAAAKAAEAAEKQAPANELRAAQGGDFAAMQSLAQRYKTGKGVKQDAVEAGKWQKKAEAALGPALQVAGMDLVPVPPGCFQMGDTFGEGESHEKPVHEVCVDSFFMGRTEVTQGQWQAVMGSNPSSFEKGDSYPVEQVFWDDVQDFIRKLNAQTGKQFRLPTEAEWEYAARSGGKNEEYAGGANLDAVAWYYDNSGSTTHPVATKQANGLGLYDMSGNVWEWCADWYGEDYYRNSSRANPQGPTTGRYRVFRGGSWLTYHRDARAAYRHGFEPDRCSGFLGFRLALPQGSR